MKSHTTFLKTLAVLMIVLATKSFAQAPQANFSVSPNPVCAGAVVHITDLSTGTPTSWTYTLNTGFGPIGTVTSSVQNPTITYNNGGTKTITLIVANASGSSTAVSQTITVLPAPQGNITPGNVTTCVGGSPTILSIATNTGATNTYSWNTGATTSSISVSPSVTTTYSCIITGSNGCTLTRSSTVSIGQPTITITSNPASICGGSTATLTANSTGQGPYTYTWSTAATTKTITTNVAGPYTATVTNGAGCTGVHTFTLGTTTTLSITAQSSQSAVCAGNTATLSATGASSYSWSTGSTNATATISPSTATTYTVVGTSGTCSGVATVSIVVHNTPTLSISSSSTSICAGLSVSITASGATNYLWSTGGNGSVIAVTPTASTTYTVRGTNQGCPARTTTISITVTPAPLVTVSGTSPQSCAGETIILTANGANTYVWDSGATTASISISPTVTTTYTVTGSSNGCNNIAVSMQNVTDCTGLTALGKKDNSFVVFPNPSNGSFSISNSSDISLSIISQSGQLIKTVLLNDANDHKATISGLANGIYFVTSPGAGLSQKIIVTH